MEIDNLAPALILVDDLINKLTFRTGFWINVEADEVGTMYWMLTDAGGFPLPKHEEIKDKDTTRYALAHPQFGSESTVIKTKTATAILWGKLASTSYNLYVTFEDMSGNPIATTYYERVRTADRFPASRFEVSFQQAEVTAD